MQAPKLAVEELKRCVQVGVSIKEVLCASTDTSIEEVLCVCAGIRVPWSGGRLSHTEW